ncbi:MAG: NACHT domain-containing NTPase [Myxacorys chilensis ATA2-1-KO14]|nr:NACHT domain-containing NTPase [Myxacorys chilensis ATA2-1-KO14]
MARRSLQASAEGIKKARKAYNAEGLTQEALAEQVNLKTRQPVSKFFAGKPIDRHVFIEICTALDLNWEEITQREAEDSIAEDVVIEAIAETVQAIREQIRPLVKERCGTMRVLDMTQPIELTGKQGIYTNVNILERITARDRREIAQLLQNAGLEEFDRVGLSRVREGRVAGIEAVKRHNKLMVLGKPGAGKSTFLKYLAMQCIEGYFFGDRVPLFITLKDFAEAKNQPDFLDYIREKITNNATQTQLQTLIQQGKTFVLLDGLDEVREEDTGRVLREIREFAARYANNHFVITCRIAAKEYIFEQFTEVEVADFDDEQISTFIRVWFQYRYLEEGKQFAKRVIKKLDENKPIKQLASNPLLLTLLCLECEESLEFPRDRAELYQRGLRTLLGKWDTSREVKRDQFYEKLSTNRKEELLSQLALKTFEQKDYFFKQRTVEQHIIDYITNLPDARTDPQALQLGSEAALKSIEAQHGLLVERARGIYSFSHLTFQEYFTAKQIVNKADYERLVEHITEKRWREVFLLTVNIMPKADRLLLSMKRKIDNLSSFNEAIQRCLTIVHKQFPNTESLLQLAEFRDFEDTEATLWLPIVRALCLDCVIEYTHNIYLAFVLEEIVENINSLHDLVHSSQELNFYKSFELAMTLENSISEATVIDLEMLASFELASQLNKTLELVKEPMYKNWIFLERITCQSNQIGRGSASWWILNGNVWKEKFKKFMTKYKSHLRGLKFNQQELSELRNYYDTNKLLVDCLNSECYVSPEVRQEIEETLLLPMSEIEKRMKE